MRSAKRRSKGFTIVELLIVIVIIGILAAIVIVAYNGVQNRAHASAASADLSAASRKLAVYQVDNGVYPPDLATIGINATPSSGTSFQYKFDNNASPQTFCVTGTNSGVSYQVSESTTPQAGGCAGHGVGGVAALTNLAPNPSVETNVTSWIASRGTGARDTTTAFSGVASYRYDANGVAGGNYASLVVPTGNISGQQIKASIRLQTSTPGLSMRTRLYFRDAANVIIGGSIDGTFITPTTSWSAASVSSTAPAGTTNIVIYTLFTTTLTAGTSVWFDGFMVTVGSTTDTYADGSSPSWVWNGTPNNSTSTGPPL